MLDKPSEKQREFVKTSEEKRSHMSKLESDIVHAIKNKKGSSDALNNVSEVESIHTLQATQTNQRRNLGITDKPQFKRKRAKVIIFLHCFYLIDLSTCVSKRVLATKLIYFSN